MSAGNDIAPDGNIVQRLVGDVVGGISADNGGEESPGSEGARGELVDQLRLGRVDALGEGKSGVVLEGVKDGES